jgi:hypothetical protein
MKAVHPPLFVVAIVLIVGVSSDLFAQGLFGPRTFGQNVGPRPRQFTSGLQHTPDGGFLGIGRPQGQNMFSTPYRPTQYPPTLVPTVTWFPQPEVAPAQTPAAPLGVQPAAQPPATQAPAAQPPTPPPGAEEWPAEEASGMESPMVQAPPALSFAPPTPGTRVMAPPTPGRPVPVARMPVTPPPPPAPLQFQAPPAAMPRAAPPPDYIVP